MDYLNLLHDYFEGNLEPGLEDKLFKQLSSDSALRDEFKHFMDIEKAASSDILSMSPSPEAAAGVFAALDIDTAPATATTKPTFLDKYGQAVWSSAFTGVFVAAIMLFLWQPWQNNQKEEFAVLKNTDIPIVSSFESLTDRDRLDNSNIERNKQGNSVNSDISSKDVDNSNLYASDRIDDKTNNGNMTTDQDEQFITNSSEHKNTINSIERQNFADNNLEEKSNYIYKTNIVDEFNKVNKDFNNYNEGELTTIEYQINDNPSFNDLTFFEKNDIEIELRTGEYWALPNASVNRSSEPILENVTGQINYRVSKNFYIGVDARQEFFFMDYQGFDQDGEEYYFEQNTNFFAFGLTGKYNFLNYENFGSFAQAYIGGNQVGQIGRFMLGFEYSPSRDYGFIFGLEGSLLRHYEDNNPFYARKIGLHYGIKFNL